MCKQDRKVWAFINEEIPLKLEIKSKSRNETVVNETSKGERERE